MLDKRITERTDRLLAGKFRDRDGQLPRDVRKVEHKAAITGFGGHTLLQIRNIYAREVDIRSAMAWESLVRMHSTLGSEVTDLLAEDLKGAFVSYLDHFGDQLSQQLSQVLSKHNPPSTVQLEIKEPIFFVQEKYELEIDIYVDSLRQRNSDPSNTEPARSNYHFHGPVGIVQTGPNASAHMVQNLGDAEIEDLVSALEIAKEAIRSSTEIVADHQTDLIAMTSESIEELQSDKPNNTRLKSMLTTIALSIQTIASAPQAYVALRYALLPLGIPLP